MTIQAARAKARTVKGNLAPRRIAENIFVLLITRLCYREAGRKVSRSEALSGFTTPRYLDLRSATESGPERDENSFRIRAIGIKSFFCTNVPCVASNTTTNAFGGKWLSADYRRLVYMLRFSPSRV